MILPHWIGPLLCVVLTSAGHLVRDGWPPIGMTNLGSRPVGGLLCILGCIALFGWAIGGALGLSVFIGFWLDQKHGEGQRARNWEDAGYLAISGSTSVAFATAVAWYFYGWPAFVLSAMALLKPLIWNFYWHGFSWPSAGWLQPTRMSAITYGAALGGLLAFMSYLTQ